MTRQPPTEKPMPGGEASVFDIVVLSDMTVPGDSDFRIAQELRCYSAAGYSVGVAHVSRDRADRLIAPEVDGCVRQGHAEIVDPAVETGTSLLIVHLHHPTQRSSAPDRGSNSERSQPPERAPNT